MCTDEEFDFSETPFSHITSNHIAQSSGRSDDDVRPFLELDSLCHHVHSADNDGRMQVQSRSEYSKLLSDLIRQLSGSHSTSLWG